MAALEPGALRHRILIERLQELRDSAGAVIQDAQTGEIAKDWVAVDTVWAEIKPLSVREFIQSAAAQSQVSARITMRHRDDLHGTLRLVHMVNGLRGKIYDPAGFFADAESGLEYVTAACREGAGVGQ